MPLPLAPILFSSVTAFSNDFEFLLFYFSLFSIIGSKLTKKYFLYEMLIFYVLNIFLMSP
jgi:hypothetical protein